MKTQLPYNILSKEMAEKFLRDLVENNECYHPDDNAHSVEWTTCAEPDDTDKTHLNHLMKQVFDFIPDPASYIESCQDTEEIKANKQFYDAIPADVRERQLFLPDNHQEPVTIDDYMLCNLLEKDVTHIPLSEAQKVLDLKVNDMCHAGYGCRVIRIK